jgi:hypothetical protein
MNARDSIAWASLAMLLVCVSVELRRMDAKSSRAQMKVSPSAVRERKAMLNKMTPVLFVREIEPVLPFWIDNLGFTKTGEFPDGNKLAFVMLQKGPVEIMYQS